MSEHEPVEATSAPEHEECHPVLGKELAEAKAIRERITDENEAMGWVRPPGWPRRNEEPTLSQMVVVQLIIGCVWCAFGYLLGRLP